MKTHTYITCLSSNSDLINILESTGVGLLQPVKFSKAHPDVSVVLLYKHFPVHRLPTSDGSLDIYSLSFCLLYIYYLFLHMLLWDSAATVTIYPNLQMPEDKSEHVTLNLEENLLQSHLF